MLDTFAHSNTNDECVGEFPTPELVDVMLHEPCRPQQRTMRQAEKHEAVPIAH